MVSSASVFSQLMGEFTSVYYLSEDGREVTSTQEASYRDGMYQAVAPYRQLFVLQIIRFWVELLEGLQYKAMEIDNEDIPFFGEIFAHYYNEDSLLTSLFNEEMDEDSE